MDVNLINYHNQIYPKLFHNNNKKKYKLKKIQQFNMYHHSFVDQISVIDESLKQ